MDIDSRGILLTKQVDLDWLKQQEPQFFQEYIKFIIDINSREVCVGMKVHRDGCSMLSNPRATKVEYIDNSVYGGNLFYEASSVVWESGLNMRYNIKNKTLGKNPRILVDDKFIEELEGILRMWVEF